MKNISKRFLLVMMTLLVGVMLVACGGGAKKKVTQAMDKVTTESLLASGQEAKKLTSDLKTLPTKDGDVVISWKTSNASALSATGKVTRLDKDTDVTLTATFSLDKVKEDKKFEFKVLAKEVEPEPEPVEMNLPEVEGSILIEDFLKLEDGKEAVLVGVITNMGPFNSFSMEDESGAVAFRVGGLNASSVSFKVGDAVQAKVKKNTFNGLVQAEIGKEDAEDETLFKVHKGEYGRLPVIDLDEVGVKAADLLPLQSRLVKAKDAVVKKIEIDNFGTINLTLDIKGGEIVLRWDNRVTSFNPIFLQSLEVGDKVDLDGVTIGWFNGPQLAVDTTTQVKNETFDDIVIPEEPVEPGDFVEFDISEDFKGATIPGAYGGFTFEGAGETSWEVVRGRNNDGYDINEGGILLQNASNNSSITVTFPNGLNDLAFQFRKAYTGDVQRTYKVEINHYGVITTKDVTPFGDDPSGRDDTIHQFVLEDLDLPGIVTVKVYAAGSATQAVFGEFTWNELEGEVVAHTVEFDVDGGTEVEDMLIADGGNLTLPEVIKHGYDFKGWYTDAAKTTEFDVETEIKADLKLYAKWEKTPIADFGTVTIAYSGVTRNFVAEENNAPLFGQNPFLVNLESNSYTTEWGTQTVGVNADGSIRLYAAGEDKTVLTLSVQEGYTITKVVITFKKSAGEQATLVLGDGDAIVLDKTIVIEGTSTYDELDISSLTISNTSADSEKTGQVWIESIVFDYEKDGVVVPTERTVELPNYPEGHKNGQVGEGQDVDITTALGIEGTVLKAFASQNDSNNKLGLYGDIRFYHHADGNGNALTFTVEEGYVITSIEITANQNPDNFVITYGDVTDGKVTDTLENLAISEITIHNAGTSQGRISSIIITYDKVTE